MLCKQFGLWGGWLTEISNIHSKQPETTYSSSHARWGCVRPLSLILPSLMERLPMVQRLRHTKTTSRWITVIRVDGWNPHQLILREYPLSFFFNRVSQIKDDFQGGFSDFFHQPISSNHRLFFCRTSALCQAAVWLRQLHPERWVA